MTIFKKILSILLRIVLSIILLVYLFKQVDEKILFEIIQHSNKPLLFIAFLVSFVPYGLCLFRWKLLIKAVKIKLPLKRVATAFAGGAFFSLFLPSTIGGDFLRSIDLVTYTKKPKEIIASTILDRLSGYVGLVIISSVAVFMGWNILEDKSVLLSLWIIIGILALLLLVLFNKFIYIKISGLLKSFGAGRIRDIITGLHEEIHLFREKPRVAISSVLISTFAQAATPITFYIIALSLGIKISLVYFFVFLPIISAITLLPISIGGLGLRDVSVVFFFAKAGVSKDPAFAMSLLSFSFGLFYGVLGGLIYVYTLHNRRLQCNQSSQICKTTSPKNS
ncbi:MAG: lysylphosphatidylglycerol synthase transmembrane domain-containing protein [Candidatus Omnitrophica bacterium]|nr:lysylphosphatidylglycerol synthase transmembrane domain-containing protein [Candidatus Omnitrophota bacterium]